MLQRRVEMKGAELNASSRAPAIAHFDWLSFQAKIAREEIRQLSLDSDWLNFHQPSF